MSCDDYQECDCDEDWTCRQCRWPDLSTLFAELTEEAARASEKEDDGG